MTPILGLLVFEAMLIAVGLLVVRLLLPRNDRHPAELWLPMAFAVGLVINAMLLTGSLAVTGWFGPWHLPALAIVAIGLHGVLWNSGRLAPLGGFSFLQRSGPAASQAFYWLLAFIVLGRVIMLHAEALRFPLFTWDGRFIWNLKAVILFHEGTVFTDAFMAPDRIHFHRDYPLLLPGAYLGVYHLAGEVHERMARLFLVHLMVFFLLAFQGAARRHCAPWIAMFLTALLAASAFRVDYTVRDGITLTAGVADVPLAFLAFLAVVAHLRGWRSRRVGWHVLGGIMTGACLLAKSEGIVALATITGMNVAAALILHGENLRRRMRPLAVAVIVPILVVLPWFVLKSWLPNFYDERFGDLIAEAGFALLVDRLPRVLSHLQAEFLGTRSWNILWPVFGATLIAALLGGSLRSGRWLPGLVVLLWLPAYLLAYLITPLEIGYHVETSIGRLLSHFHAIALLQVAVVMGLWMRRGRVHPNGLPQGRTGVRGA